MGWDFGWGEREWFGYGFQFVLEREKIRAFSGRERERKEGLGIVTELVLVLRRGQDRVCIHLD